MPTPLQIAVSIDNVTFTDPLAASRILELWKKNGNCRDDAVMVLSARERPDFKFKTTAKWLRTAFGAWKPVPETLEEFEERFPRDMGLQQPQRPRVRESTPYPRVKQEELEDPEDQAPQNPVLQPQRDPRLQNREAQEARLPAPPRPRVCNDPSPSNQEAQDLRFHHPAAPSDPRLFKREPEESEHQSPAVHEASESNMFRQAMRTAFTPSAPVGEHATLPHRSTQDQSDLGLPDTAAARRRVRMWTPVDSRLYWASPEELRLERGHEPDPQDWRLCRRAAVVQETRRESVGEPHNEPAQRNPEEFQAPRLRPQEPQHPVLQLQNRATQEARPQQETLQDPRLSEPPSRRVRMWTPVDSRLYWASPEELRVERGLEPDPQDLRARRQEARDPRMQHYHQTPVETEMYRNEPQDPRLRRQEARDPRMQHQNAPNPITHHQTPVGSEMYRNEREDPRLRLQSVRVQPSSGFQRQAVRKPRNLRAQFGLTEEEEEYLYDIEEDLSDRDIRRMIANRRARTPDYVPARDGVVEPVFQVQVEGSPRRSRSPEFRRTVEEELYLNRTTPEYSPVRDEEEEPEIQILEEILPRTLEKDSSGITAEERERMLRTPDYLKRRFVPMEREPSRSRSSSPEILEDLGRTEREEAEVHRKKKRHPIKLFVAFSSDKKSFTRPHKAEIALNDHLTKPIADHVYLRFTAQEKPDFEYVKKMKKLKKIFGKERPIPLTLDVLKRKKQIFTGFQLHENPGWKLPVYQMMSPAPTANPPVRVEKHPTPSTSTMFESSRGISQTPSREMRRPFYDGAVERRNVPMRRKESIRLASQMLRQIKLLDEEQVNILRRKFEEKWRVPAHGCTTCPYRSRDTMDFWKHVLSEGHIQNSINKKIVFTRDFDYDQIKVIIEMVHKNGREIIVESPYAVCI